MPRNPNQKEAALRLLVGKDNADDVNDTTET